MESILALIEKFKVSNAASPGLFLEREVHANVTGELRRIIPIVENNSPLVSLPENMDRFEPHPYAALGAEYPSISPWHLREAVIERLKIADNLLGERLPGARLKIFDAYRPLSVQQFMIDYECNKHALITSGSPLSSLSASEQKRVTEEVMEFWSPPSHDPLYPPPHSTGGAVDLVIIDSRGEQLPMGTEIDEIAEASYPHFFDSETSEPFNSYHQNRQLLNAVMVEAGFHRLPSEWWHFSYGDQIWALIESLVRKEPVSACYGRIEES